MAALRARRSAVAALLAAALGASLAAAPAARGEEETGTFPYIAGVVVGSQAIPVVLAGNANWFFMPALGLGHLAQGRYLDRGWIFSISQLGVAGAALVAHSVECSSGSRYCKSEGITASIALGIVAEIALHAWEVGDLLIAPPFRNARIRRERQAALALVPAPGGRGAGLAASIPF
jgi:hypothetical protein